MMPRNTAKGFRTMLVLSIFPGFGLLDYAFEKEGFTVVRGPDPIWGGDVRTFHPPPGVFDGIMGGDPCQSHSGLANLVRAKGLEPTFPDMTEDYLRVIEEARPAWFLRENVSNAPDVAPEGYDVRSFILDNSTLDSGDGTGNEQMRKRKFWFGTRDGAAPELRSRMNFALELLPERVNTVAGDPRTSFIPGGQAEVNEIQRTRREAVTGAHDAGEGSDFTHWRKRKATVTGRHHSNELRASVERGAGWVGKQEKRSLAEMLRLQGMPEDWLDHQPWTMSAKRKGIGNGVAVPMGRALAKAIRSAMADRTV